MKYFFKEACTFEGDTFEIGIDIECTESVGTKMCKHSHSKSIKTHSRYDGSTWEEVIWICPKMIIAYNEGGYNKTGVCFDCIIEANNLLKDIRNEHSL